MCEAEQEARQAGPTDTGHPDAGAWLPYRYGVGGWGWAGRGECLHEHLAQDTVTTTQHSTSSKNNDDNHDGDNNFPEGLQSK